MQPYRFLLEGTQTKNRDECRPTWVVFRVLGLRCHVQVDESGDPQLVSGASRQ
jgi:hypothetical protein